MAMLPVYEYIDKSAVGAMFLAPLDKNKKSITFIGIQMVSRETGLVQFLRAVIGNKNRSFWTRSGM